MMVLAQLLIGGVSVLIGGLILSSARGRRDRARRLSELASDADETNAETVEGPVAVERPADPERRPPEHYQPGAESDAEAALWAWRVRRERSGDHGTHWETVESGLAVGEWTVRDDWEHVRVDAESVPHDPDDPFAAERLFLGDPEVDVHVEERDGLLDTLGGDYGPLEDVEVSLSVGSGTTTPDKYQATVIREGDEVLVRGRVEELDGERVVRGGDGHPPEIAVGNLDERAQRTSRAARTRAMVGASVVVLGVGAAVASLLL